ncbi:hypothetical protein [Hydrogenophaga sp. NFH-34]|uniref:hypothetical protein n=1 Tax=Hydrogenophaga sp. NFH-34 TaxID=2744446 RepID=UPI001F246E54|nr:hypothetical protein [Hydrogenophaga sp. NFH-34]
MGTLVCPQKGQHFHALNMRSQLLFPHLSLHASTAEEIAYTTPAGNGTPNREVSVSKAESVFIRRGSLVFSDASTRVIHVVPVGCWIDVKVQSKR